MNNFVLNFFNSHFLSQIRSSDKGYLCLALGPMFSGKTTFLIQVLTTLADLKFKVTYINNLKDIRRTESSDNTVTTHHSNFSHLSSKITPFKVNLLSEVDISSFDVIGIDESNFFDDLVPVVLDWLNIHHKIIFIVGLDGDAFKRPIGHSLDLLTDSDFFIKLTAYCKYCLDSSDILPAPFTGRLSNSSDSIVVGGSDLYVPLCRSCHRKHLATLQD